MSIKFVKKTILLNQSFVNRARRIFDVKTEKDAVNKALEMVVEEDEIISIHKEIGGLGKIERIFI